MSAPHDVLDPDQLLISTLIGSGDAASTGTVSNRAARRRGAGDARANAGDVRCVPGGPAL
jgi:hypothetical protein